MNPGDFIREMHQARRERVAALVAREDNRRRLELIAKMEQNEGDLTPDDLDELRGLQRQLGLPSDF